MFEDAFRDKSDITSRGETVADFRKRRELPLSFIVQSVHVKTALEKEPGFFRELVQGILKPVIDLCQKSGAELDAEKIVGELDGVADFESCGILVNLKVGAPASYANDFGFEPDVAEHRERNFILRHSGLELDGQHIAVDADYVSCVVFKHENTPAVMIL